MPGGFLSAGFVILTQFPCLQCWACNAGQQKKPALLNKAGMDGQGKMQILLPVG